MVSKVFLIPDSWPLIPERDRTDDPLLAKQVLSLSGIRHQRSGISNFRRLGGAERDRTDDLLLAKQALSQLSYSPVPQSGGSGWIRTIDPRLIKTVL